MRRYLRAFTPCLLIALCMTVCLVGRSFASEPSWIWGTKDSNVSAIDGLCLFKKEFTLTGTPTKGILRITCDDQYVVRVNDRLVGVDEKWQDIEQYDVTSILRDGENTIFIRASNVAKGAAGLLASLEINLADGKSQTIHSDDSWAVTLQKSGTWNPDVAKIKNWKNAFTSGTRSSTTPWKNSLVLNETTTVVGASQRLRDGFELRDGDRVLFLGNTVIEREQRYGYWEAALTTRLPDKHIVFRNLGWSGDTVLGEARARFGSQKDGFEPAALVRSFLTQDGGDEALTKALTLPKQIPPDVAKICIRAARIHGRNVDSLVQRLETLGGLTKAVKLSPAEREGLLTDVKKSGDAQTGEDVYWRQELNCQKCHAIGGAGGKVGLDLASIGASAPPDYILDSLLDPDAKIKENYHSQVVATDEGHVVSGVVLRETTDSLILRDAEDQEISIPLDSIEERKDGGSLMPAGLLNELTRQELLDLVRFLTELGKVGDFATPSAPLVRSWETLADAEENSVRWSSEAEVAQQTKLVWEPVYSRVNGVLPAHELPEHRPQNASEKVSFVRFPIEMTTAGKRTLKLLRAGDGLRLFVDGKPVKSEFRVELDLQKGSHAVVLAADNDADAEPIAVMVE